MPVKIPEHKIGSGKCMYTNINIGVPQGSILGLILFLVYNNELPDSSHILFPTFFADDTNISISDKNVNDIVPLLDNELEIVKQ